jgi:hypothetical protein
LSDGICQGVDSVKITVNANPGASAGIDDTVCFSKSALLGATGGVSYSWVPSGSLSNPLIANPVSTPNVTTIYTVYVTDNNGCIANDQVTVFVNPQIALSTAGFQVTCFGQCNGQAIVIPSGGTQPYAYSWAPGGQTTAAINNLCPNIYTITVTDARGCTFQDTAHVVQPSDITITTSTTIANCGVNNGQACANASGGTFPCGIQLLNLRFVQLHFLLESIRLQ